MRLYILIRFVLKSIFFITRLNQRDSFQYTSQTFKCNYRKMLLQSSQIDTRNSKDKKDMAVVNEAFRRPGAEVVKLQPILQNEVKIASQRWIQPGDFLVHQEFGIGQYLGIRMVDLTPVRKDRVFEPTVVVQYADGEISWFQRLAVNELWLYRSKEVSDVELSNIVDRKKWIRRKKAVVDSSNV